LEAHTRFALVRLHVEPHDLIAREITFVGTDFNALLTIVIFSRIHISKIIGRIRVTESKFTMLADEWCPKRGDLIFLLEISRTCCSEVLLCCLRAGGVLKNFNGTHAFTLISAAIRKVAFTLRIYIETVRQVLANLSTFTPIGHN
jgi:hypothetical protein